ncbi:MAG TPA: TetR/AcrR family transcriptional regulator [Pseudolysinimonas sp.]|jgi:AcrR family transcriptional regulator
MARPRSDERRTAILSAATRIIAAQGLTAATATIAREAGVSNGSLFLYFDTKSTLVNELYLALKIEMAAAALDGIPVDAGIRTKSLHMWDHWLDWAIAHPQKRRALAQLDVSEDVTADSHRSASSAMSGIAELLDQSRREGALRDAPLSFVVTLLTAIAEATIDSIIREPGQAAAHRIDGFDALWRVLAGTNQ